MKWSVTTTGVRDGVLHCPPPQADVLTGVDWFREDTVGRGGWCRVVMMRVAHQAGTGDET